MAQWGFVLHSADARRWLLSESGSGHKGGGKAVIESNAVVEAHAVTEAHAEAQAGGKKPISDLAAGLAAGSHLASQLAHLSIAPEVRHRLQDPNPQITKLHICRPQMKHSATGMELMRMHDHPQIT